MLEISTSGLMSGDGKRSGLFRAQPPRPSSTLLDLPPRPSIPGSSSYRWRADPRANSVCTVCRHKAASYLPSRSEHGAIEICKPQKAVGQRSRRCGIIIRPGLGGLTSAESNFTSLPHRANGWQVHRGRRVLVALFTTRHPPRLRRSDKFSACIERRSVSTAVARRSRHSKEASRSTSSRSTAVRAS